MNFRVIILFINILLVSLLGCKKDSNHNWIYCQECSAENWIGSYDGRGDYFNGSENKQYLQVETQMDIIQLNGNALQMNIVVSDFYQVSFYTTKDDNEYYINVPGSNKSLYLVLAQSGSQSRITGTAKSYHYKVDSLIVDHSISFELLKHEK
jgi:hypothetical protein